ncbi:WD40-repeat-containing domain protein, partial [Zopfochytrium polystomum]
QKKKIKGVGKISRRFDEVAFRAAQTELLLSGIRRVTEHLSPEGAERTYKFTQEQIKEAVDLNTQAKIFDLRLPDFGPYTADYTRNGRHLVIGGRKGHVATMDWKTKKMGCELHLGETVRDVKWLHNETLFAVAQKKFIYIYDNFGTEVHCLKEHLEPTHLDFLPYHFLLVSANGRGHLNYQDTSTGAMVVSMKTGMGPCRALAQNPWNAVMTMGHGDGVVTMWTPNHPTPVVNMLAHKGPVQAVAVDRGGNYMVTTGLDGRMKVFDVRTYKTLNEYYTPTPAAQLSISQLGLLAVGYGSHVTVWRNVLGEDKARSPYMYHHIADGSAVSRLRFCPYDDVLGVGHAGGFASLAVPGAGEPNYDAMEGVNPYITKEQRKTSEVRALLEKIQPDMIVLDPTAIGTVKGTGSVKGVAIPKILFEANNPGETYKPKEPKPALPRRPPRQQEQRIVKGSPMDPKASILIGGAANLTVRAAFFSKFLFSFFLLGGVLLRLFFFFLSLSCARVPPPPSAKLSTSHSPSKEGALPSKGTENRSGRRRSAERRA